MFVYWRNLHLLCYFYYNEIVEEITRKGSGFVQLAIECGTLTQKTTVIIPNSKVRSGVEKALLKKSGMLINTEVLTLTEWLDKKTVDDRLMQHVELLSASEQHTVMLAVLKEMPRVLFQEHQIDTALAKLLVQEFRWIERAEQLDGLFYPQYEQMLKELYAAYRARLEQEAKWDDACMLQHLLQKPRIREERVYYFALQSFTQLEQKLLAHVEAQVLELPVGIEANVQVVETYGQKLGLEHFILTKLQTFSADECVLLYTDESLVPHIYTTLQQYNISASFSRGRAFTSTEAYPLICALLDYVDYNYDTSFIQAALLSGHVAYPHRSILRKVLQADGVDYGKRLANIVEKLAQKPELAEEELQKLAECKQFFVQLHNGLDEVKRGKELLRFAEVVRAVLTKNNKQLNGSIKAFTLLLEQLAAGQPTFATFQDFKSYVLKEASKLKVESSSEQPGKVFVAHYEDQLMISRPVVGVFGLDSATFPTIQVSSPFIRAEGYDALHRPTPLDQYKKSTLYLETILSQVTDDVILYANTFNTSKVRKQNPNQFWLRYKKPDVCTNLTTVNKGELVQSETCLKVAPKEQFEMDWLLKRDEQYVNTLSPTAASRLVDCSRKYFLHYQLYMRGLASKQVTLDQWLSKQLLGTLYHEVFENCVKLWITDKSEAQFEARAVEIFEQYKAVYKPVSSAHYTVEVEKMKEALAQFKVHLHESVEAGWEPFQVEVEVPKGTCVDFSPLFEKNGEERKPIKVALKGFIDRVDRKEDGGEVSYRTIDYKTGKAKYVEPLQLLIYNEALPKVGEQFGDTVVKATSDSAFYMCGEHTLINFDMDELTAGKTPTLTTFENRLTAFTLEGVKLKESSDACKFCDYKALCKGLETIK